MLKRLNVNKLKALKEPPVARAAAMEQRRGKRRRLPVASAAQAERSRQEEAPAQAPQGHHANQRDRCKRPGGP